MPQEPTRNPVVESKGTKPKVGIGQNLLNMITDTASTVRDVYTEILTKDQGGKWGDHAVADNLIPHAIESRGLSGQERQDVQSYIGGYDFVSKFPESGEGAKVLAYAHQTRDIVTKGAVAFLGKGLRGLLDVAKTETRGYEGNVRGIEAARRDLEKDTLKQAEEFGHPSQELVDQAIKEERTKKIKSD